MESAGLRNRQKLSITTTLAQEANMTDSDGDLADLQPPKYIIDLSRPPIERYKHIAQDFKNQIASLPGLFDEIVYGLHLKLPLKTVQYLAYLCLRRVHNHEETEELRGIHQVTGVEMYLLVAFNVLLDLLMGCTSGGARVNDRRGKIRMLHFRTLDWGMDALRKVVVHLDFVEKPGGTIIASSVTYVGFVGVLTGVRKGLSISLNFRPNHNASTFLANSRFYLHLLFVLFGFRPSISSLLRQVLLPSLYSSPVSGTSRTLESIEAVIPRVKSTAAYLIFSDGDRTMTFEKDYNTAVVRASNQFIVACNHDASYDGSKESSVDAVDSHNALRVAGIADLVFESISRKEKITRLWKRSSNTMGRESFSELQDHPTTVTAEDVFKWLDTHPINNEETHYGVVMDPKMGKVIWMKVFPDPI